MTFCRTSVKIIPLCFALPKSSFRLALNYYTEYTMEEEEILNFVSQLGFGLRHPHSDFYKDGNDDCQSLKPYGICDFDDETFSPKLYDQFSCHIPGCDRTFETVVEYESHYNSCHCYTCKECNKNLPNYHLLDLHISESHDSFFMALAKKKPMYKCFLEECKDSFMNPLERRDHCIKIHKFPHDFRFDSANKIKSRKKPNKKIASQEGMDTAESSDSTSKMDTSDNKSKKNQKTAEFRGFNFGRGQGRRKPVFYNFSKDLMDSLPQS